MFPTSSLALLVSDLYISPRIEKLTIEHEPLLWSAGESLYAKHIREYLCLPRAYRLAPTPCSRASEVALLPFVALTLIPSPLYLLQHIGKIISLSFSSCAMAATTTAPATHNPIVLWDSIGPAYEDAFHGLRTQLTSIDWILSELEKSSIEKARTLDIGCGTGRPVCSRLADAGHDAQGIDISPEMIKAAEQRVPNAKFLVADLTSWSPDGEEFDVITAYFSMIASLSQDQIKETIKRIYSWLKPGGLFVFATVPVEANNVEIKWMGRDVVVSGLSPESFGEWFRDVGFEVVKEEESKFTPKGIEAGLTKNSEDVWEEAHLFIYAKKK